MVDLPVQGLALLGLKDLRQHLAAIEQHGALRVVGCWGEVPAGAAISSVPDPAELLLHPQTKGVVVGADGALREYWLRQAAKAGKPVLSCELPTPSFARLQDMVEQARASGGVICMLPRLRVLGEDLPPADGTWYFSLRVRVPRAALTGTRQGLLVFWGVALFQVLAERFGRLDSVYARTRSLGLNRPEEDVVSAQLRFANGVEGLVSLSGLGSESEMVLEEWSEGGARCLRFVWLEPGAAALGQAYADFAQVLRPGAEAPPPLRLPLEGLRWAEWFQQSARRDREIYANEVAHE